PPRSPGLLSPVRAGSGCRRGFSAVDSENRSTYGFCCSGRPGPDGRRSTCHLFSLDAPAGRHRPPNTGTPRPPCCAGCAAPVPPRPRWMEVDVPAVPPQGTGGAAPPSEPGFAPPAMLRRLRWTWLPGNIGFNLVWGAVTGILMALQVQEIDPDGKVFNLALLTGAGAAMTMVVQPIAGRLSDRTRSR